MGSKKHKKHHRGEKRPRSLERSSEGAERIEKPLKLVLKVGGGDTPSASPNAYISSPAPESEGSLVENEAHGSRRHKKKKKKRSKDKHKHHHHHERHHEHHSDDPEKRAKRREHGDRKEHSGEKLHERVEQAEPVSEPVTTAEEEDGEDMEVEHDQDHVPLADMPDRVNKDDGEAEGEDEEDVEEEDEAVRAEEGEEETHENEGEPPAKRQAVDQEETTATETPSQSKQETRPARPKRPGVDAAALRTLLDTLWGTLERKDVNRFFAWPVTDVIAPGYSIIIRSPMDFRTMKKKIESGDYVSVAEFKTDFKLMCDNAMTYNNSETIYYKAAKTLLHVGIKAMNKDRLSRLCSSLGILNELVGRDFNGEAAVTPAAETNGGATAAVKPPKPKVLFKPRMRWQRYRFGFLRRDKSGATTLAVLNPDNVSSETGSEQQNLTVNLGLLTGKLAQGTGQLAGFKEDKRNKAVPVSYLNYGDYGSYGPIYDSSFANLNKEDSDLIYATYGDETGVQYAESLMDYVKDSDDFAVKFVNNLLDALTYNEHSKCQKQLEESKLNKDKENVAGRPEGPGSVPQQDSTGSAELVPPQQPQQQQSVQQVQAQAVVPTLAPNPPVQKTPPPPHHAAPHTQHPPTSTGPLPVAAPQQGQVMLIQQNGQVQVVHPGGQVQVVPQGQIQLSQGQVLLVQQPGGQVQMVQSGQAGQVQIVPSTVQGQIMSSGQGQIMSSGQGQVVSQPQVAHQGQLQLVQGSAGQGQVQMLQHHNCQGQLQLLQQAGGQGQGQPVPIVPKPPSHGSGPATPQVWQNQQQFVQKQVLGHHASQPIQIIRTSQGQVQLVQQSGAKVQILQQHPGSSVQQAAALVSVAGQPQPAAAAPQNSSSDKSAEQDVKVNLSELRSLSDLGIDVSFLEDFQPSTATSAQQKQVTDRLDATSVLLQDLSKAQTQRLSDKPPSHLHLVKPPSQREEEIAAKVMENLKELAAAVAPCDIVSAQAVRRAMGVTNDPVDTEAFTEDDDEEEANVSEQWAENVATRGGGHCYC
ncbi:PREDICTED: bromodomain-containing protein 7-like [Priapulus caudatus]|uniref:Bromodomain-containing protein 7-like n=1 Tax=Priapulus caudatus TaxID=37621 RepID=A0ABM1DXF4_PRICU|nr:PREDICTED: bromodomain-containing protein 7-like [Priapulus caudatus]